MQGFSAPENRSLSTIDIFDKQLAVLPGLRSSSGFLDRCHVVGTRCVRSEKRTFPPYDLQLVSGEINGGLRPFFQSIARMLLLSGRENKLRYHSITLALWHRRHRKRQHQGAGNVPAEYVSVAARHSSETTTYLVSTRHFHPKSHAGRIYVLWSWTNDSDASTYVTGDSS